MLASNEIDYEVSSVELQELYRLVQAVVNSDWDNIRRAIGKLRHFVGDHLQLIQHLENTLFSVAPPETHWYCIEHYFDCKKLDDPFVQYLNSIVVLREVLKSDKPADMFMGIGRFPSREPIECWTTVFETLLEFIESYYSEALNSVEQEPNSHGFHLANMELQRGNILLVKNDILHNEGQEIIRGNVFMVGEFDGFFEDDKCGLSAFLRECANDTRLKDLKLNFYHSRTGDTGKVDRRIWNSITWAHIVIVDLAFVERKIAVDGSERTKAYSNFNVAYELGLAHALGKNTIILINEDKSEAGTAFDIITDDAIKYSPSNLDVLREDLVLYLKRAFASNHLWPRSSLEAR